MPNDELVTVGPSRASCALRQWRLQAGLSQTMGALRAGFATQSYMSQIETGERRPGLATALRIERRLQIPVSWWGQPADPNESFSFSYAPDGEAVA